MSLGGHVKAPRGAILAFGAPRTSEPPVSATPLRWSCLLLSRVSIYCSRQAWQTQLSQQMVLLGQQTVVMRPYLSARLLENGFNSKMTRRRGKDDFNFQRGAEECGWSRGGAPLFLGWCVYVHMV